MVIKSIIGATSAWILFITCTTPAAASVIYSYTGNVFDDLSASTSYTAEMSVSGTVELTAPLAYSATTSVEPSHFSFYDGIKKIDTANAYDYEFVFTTDGNGTIINWAITLSSQQPEGNGGILIHDITTHGTVQWDGPVNSYDHARFSCSPPVPCLDLGPSYSDTAYVAGVGGAPGSWSIVPVPAPFWLFGSGLLGLIGVARRKGRV